MIKALRLHNFKCFADQHLHMNRLTLLTGLNGMGKSSIIQSLLLLRQSNEQGFLNPSSLRSRELSGGLLLNGDLISLGTAHDIYCEFAEDNEIHIGVEFSTKYENWRFSYEDSNSNTNLLDLIFEAVGVTEESILDRMKQLDISREIAIQQIDFRLRTLSSRRLQEEPIFSDKFQYLQAERFGPRVSFPTSDYHVRQRRQLGSHGEFAVHFLDVFGDSQDVLLEMRHKGAPSDKLRAQVETWLSEISPGARLEITPNYSTDSVSIRFGYAGDTIASRPYRATNVGFGLSYLLPVLVGLLSAKKGALLLLENPEAHLHPRGQSMIGLLIALAAKSGVQVIVETHSDHILNGIRLAVHDQQISPDLVQIHYFGREEFNGSPKASVVSPKIDSNGRISEWPDGFFDEWDNSLSRLLMPFEFSLT